MKPMKPMIVIVPIKKINYSDLTLFQHLIGYTIENTICYHIAIEPTCYCSPSFNQKAWLLLQIIQEPIKGHTNRIIRFEPKLFWYKSCIYIDSMAKPMWSTLLSKMIMRFIMVLKLKLNCNSWCKYSGSLPWIFPQNTSSYSHSHYRFVYM